MMYKIFKRDVLPVLPGFYTFDEIYSIFEEYYPFDLRAFEFELNGYRHQDKTLSKIQHRKRYYVKSPKKYLECGRGFEYTDLRGARLDVCIEGDCVSIEGDEIPSVYDVEPDQNNKAKDIGF